MEFDWPDEKQLAVLRMQERVGLLSRADALVLRFADDRKRICVEGPKVRRQLLSLRWRCPKCRSMLLMADAFSYVHENTPDIVCYFCHFPQLCKDHELALQALYQITPQGERQEGFYTSVYRFLTEAEHPQVECL